MCCGAPTASPLRSDTALARAIAASGGKPGERRVPGEGKELKVAIQPVFAQDPPKTARPVDDRTCWRSRGMIMTQLPSRGFSGERATELKNATLISVPEGIVRATGLSAKSIEGPIGSRGFRRCGREGAVAFLALMAVVQPEPGGFQLLPIPIMDAAVILLLVVEMLNAARPQLRVKEAVFKLGFRVPDGRDGLVIYNDILQDDLPG